MNTAKTMLVGLTAAMLAGCATTAKHEGRHGMLSETAGRTVPSDVKPAVIYQIDGQRVHYGRGAHPVAPGVHTVLVWPVAAGPRSGTPIPGAHATAQGTTVEPLEVTVEPGARYEFGARVIRTRVYAGDQASAEPLGPWRTRIVPVIVRSTGT